MPARARWPWRRLLALLLVLALVPVASVAHPAHATGATTWTVSTTKDTTTPSAANCTGTSCLTLRDALFAAQSGDSISLASLTGTITIVRTLPISTSVTIAGPVTQTLTVKGNQSFTLFSVPNGVGATVANLTMSGGMGLGKPYLGGAFNITATLTHTTALTLTNDLVTNNPGPNPADGLLGKGGGLYVTAATGGQATVVLSNTTVSHNASVLGGGIYATTTSGTHLTLTVLNSHVDSNTATEVGGIEISGGGAAAVLLQGSTVSSNWIYGTADLGIAGGMDVNGTPSTVTLDHSQVQLNLSAAYGLYVFGQGTLTLINSGLGGNQSPQDNGQCAVAGTPTTPPSQCGEGVDLAVTGPALTWVHSGVGRAQISN